MLTWGGFIILTGMSAYLWYQLKSTRRFSIEKARQVDMYLETLDALSRSNQGFGERLIEAENTIKKLIAERSSIQYPIGTPQTVFMQAKKLLSLGASLEEVEKSCGLTKSEAKLIAMTVDTVSEPPCHLD